MLGVLTGELSGLVEGGSPANVTLLPSITDPDPLPPGFMMSFLNSSDLQTDANNARTQTIVGTCKHKEDSIVAF